MASAVIFVVPGLPITRAVQFAFSPVNANSTMTQSVFTHSKTGFASADALNNWLPSAHNALTLITASINIAIIKAAVFFAFNRHPFFRLFFLGFFTLY
ncbi:hypothetical protein SDC9_163265 [bioreactor metagenome]|uniref:Uncharacterized protein n=1 Tax=bioreactor metagenome TaxID=1076179 RepID=A0A645FR94_9ZZZZ